ncbi:MULTISPECIES: hypothetical protein [Acinetobacter]|nr:MULTISPECIES: hypothetical protein [Acinetobacter]
MKNNHKHYLKSLVEYMKPLATENHHFKNFKLSQQHQGIKGVKK